MLGTFQKASLILDLFTPARPEWGVSEVARTLHLPPSSTHLLLTSLTGLGVLHRTATGRYRLGFRLLHLTRILLENTPWRDIARREMQLLREQTGETCILSALDGGQVIRVEALPGHLAHSVPPLTLGHTPPLHATASGKILAAYRPDEVHLTPPFTPYTPNTLTDPEELASELRGVQERGLAFSIGELRPGICSVAAPVHNHNGEVIAALSLSAPQHRFETRKTELIQAATTCAARISGQIGHAPHDDQPLHWASVAGREELRPARKRKNRGRA